MAKDTDLKSFIYSGTDNKGKKVSGRVVALNLREAKEQLRKNNIKLTKLKLAPTSKSLFGSREKPIKAIDIAIFARQMATMTSAGVSIVRCLDVVIEGSNHVKFNELIRSIKISVESGDSFSEALRKQNEYFDELFCNLVEAGENSGSLENMLNRIAEYKEKTESLKRKIKKAMFYPVTVIVVSLIVSIVLLGTVVPTFKEMFEDFGAELPFFTQIVLDLSDLIRKYGIQISVGFAAFIYGMVKFHKKNIAFQHKVQEMMLKFPVFGKLLHKSSLARVTRTLAITFSAGLPLPDALLSVSKVAGNIVYTRAVLDAREGISTGDQLYASLARHSVFPAMVIQMIRIGEESGALENMASKIASIYEEEVDTAVDGLSSLLEPFIMIFLGSIIGSMVVAMYLPIFKIGSVI